MRLSLCIPTYKRAALLQEALCAIAAQWHELNPAQQGQMEVIVSDNDSPDETPELIARFCREHPALKLNYIRQKKNVGAGNNVVFLIPQAAGDFVLLLSDDDILLPGALRRIFSLTDQHPEMDAFCLNARTFANQVEEIKPPVFKIAEDKIIADPDQALLFLGTWITFLSVLIFRREAIAGEDYGSRGVTNIPQSFPFVDTLARKRGLYVCRVPFIAVRDNYTGGYDFFQVFVSRFEELMRHAVSRGYAPGVTRQVLRRHLRLFLFPYLRTARRREAFGEPNHLDYGDGVRRLLRVYFHDPFLWLVVLPSFLVPSAVLRAVYAFRQASKSP